MKNISRLVFYTILLISSVSADNEDCETKINPTLIREKSTLIYLDFNDILDNLKSDCKVSVDIVDPDIDTIADDAFAYSIITDLLIDNKYRGLNLTENSFRGLTQLETLEINTPIKSSDYKKLFEPISVLKHLALSIHKNTTEILEEILPVLQELISFSIFDYLSWTIDSKTFVNAAQSITNLTIFGSEIEVIHKNSFSSMKGLKVLEFQYNGMKKIESGAFNNLKLTSLEFTGNRLDKIKRGTFSGLDVQDLQLWIKKDTQIQDGAFENSTIQYLILDSGTHDSIDDATRSAWGLSNSTTIFISV